MLPDYEVIFTRSGYGSIYGQASVNFDDGYLIRCGENPRSYYQLLGKKQANQKNSGSRLFSKRLFLWLSCVKKDWLFRRILCNLNPISHLVELSVFRL